MSNSGDYAFLGLTQQSLPNSSKQGTRKLYAAAHNRRSTTFINEDILGDLNIDEQHSPTSIDENNLKFEDQNYEMEEDSVDCQQQVEEESKEEDHLQSLKYLEEVDESQEETQRVMHDSQSQAIHHEVNDGSCEESIIDKQYLQIGSCGEGEQTLHQLNDMIPKEHQLFVACLIKDHQMKKTTKVVNDQHKLTSRNNIHGIQRSNSQCRLNSQRGQNTIEQIIPKKIELMTTKIPSQYLFKMKSNSGNPNLSEIHQFLPGAESAQTFVQAFDDQVQPDNLLAFQFDTCLSGLQNHDLTTINDQVITFIRGNQLFSNKQSLSGTTVGNISQEQRANNVIFIFGQHKAKKSEIFNILNKNSLISKYFETIKEPLRFLRVSLFYCDEEHVLTQKSFHNETNSKKDYIGQELRQSFRNKTNLIKKLAQITNKKSGQTDIEQCQQEILESSHLLIQLNNVLFIDLGGIEALNNVKNLQIIQSLTLNFGSVTNEILKLSPFYENHDFQQTEAQQMSMFNAYLRAQLSKNSKIALICCVTSEQKLQSQTLIALDYCHKIKCYFNGLTEEEIKTQLLTDSDHLSLYERSMLQDVGKLFRIFWDYRAKVKSGSIITKLENVKERALEIQRACSSQQGVNEVKKMLAILMKEIETEIQKVRETSISITKSITTPRKGLQGNKSVGYLRYRRNDHCSRSASALDINVHSLNKQIGQNSKPNLLLKQQNSTTSRKSRSNSRQRNNNVPSISNERKSISRIELISPNSAKRNKGQMSLNRPQSVQSSNCNKSQQAKKHYSSQKVSQQFQIDPRLFEDYHREKLLKAVDTLQGDSRETPQFQQDSLCNNLGACINSSLYVKTSATSSLKANRRLNSQYASIGNNQKPIHGEQSQKSELYCVTTDKKSTDPQLSRKRSGNKKASLPKLLNLTSNQDSIDQENNQTFLNSNGFNQLSLKKQNALKLQIESQQLEIEKLKQQLKEAQIKTKRQEKAQQRKVEDFEEQVVNRDKIISSLEQQKDILKNDITSIQSQVQQLQTEKDEEKQTNELILKQIQNMKLIIENFKDKEKDKEQLLLKLKQKDDKIREMQKDIYNIRTQLDEVQNESSQNTLSNMEIKVKMLKEENELLIISQNQKIESLEHKFIALMQDYKHLINENSILKEEVAEKNQTIVDLQRATDNYKEQTMDLKHEVKLLKNANGISKGSSRQSESHINESSENDSVLGNKKQEKVKQKETVLGDIRNLIQEYKKERRQSIANKQ